MSIVIGVLASFIISGLWFVIPNRFVPKNRRLKLHCYIVSLVIGLFFLRPRHPDSGVQHR